MKRRPQDTTVTALAAHLRLSSAQTLTAIREAGITLTPVERHYTDDRPRTRRNWRPLTPQEADAVIRLVRARQGARILRRRPRPPTDAEPSTDQGPDAKPRSE